MENDEWILHTGIGCPIPWAKYGEWNRRLRNGSVGIEVPFTANAALGWNWYGENTDIVAWQLTDGWIPIIDKRCPQALGWLANTWEYRCSDGTISKGNIDIISRLWSGDVVAVRLIKEEVKPLKKEVTIHLKTLVSEPILYGFKPEYESYLRFRASPRGKEALAMIGKREGRRFKPLGEDTINDIAAEALRKHDKLWPRKK
jgi:hypothetical protein